MRSIFAAVGIGLAIAGSCAVAAAKRRAEESCAEIMAPFRGQQTQKVKVIGSDFYSGAKMIPSAALTISITITASIQIRLAYNKIFTASSGIMGKDQAKNMNSPELRILRLARLRRLQ